MDKTLKDLRGWSDIDVSDIKKIKFRLNMENVTGWSTVMAYIKAGHGLATLKAQTDDWTAFLRTHKIATSRDHRARMLARHDAALLTSGVESLVGAIEFCQGIEAAPDAPSEPTPAKMGRPRKAEAEKWRTRLERVLKDAPDDVEITRDGNQIVVQV